MRSKPVEVRLDPVDNQRLARLCGALDANLRQIDLIACSEPFGLTRL